MTELMKTEPGTQRTLEVVTAEIRKLDRQFNRIRGVYAVEIGRRLTEAKGMVPFGAWGDYIKEQTPYSQSTVNNLMLLYEQFGDSNLSLFDMEANSQLVERLTYTQLLELAALPAGDRTEFVRENDVEEMSRRELHEAIRERNEARLEAERYKAACLELEEAKASADHAEASRAKMEQDMNMLNERLREMDQELRELKDRPVETAVLAADLAELEKARAEGEQAAREGLEAEMTSLKESLEKAREKERKTRDKLRNAEASVELLKRYREQTSASRELAEFKVLFRQLQDGVNRMAEVIRTMEDQGDGETAGKVRRALGALAGAVREIAEEPDGKETE